MNALRTAAAPARARSHRMAPPPAQGSAIARSAAALLLVALACLAAATWAVQQHALLWVRLSPAALERLVPDAVSAPLPARLPLTELRSLCATEPSGVARISRQALRQALAACAAEPALQPQGQALTTALAGFEAQWRAQREAAATWLVAHAQQAPAARARLEAELSAIQAESQGLLDALGRHLGPLSGSPRTERRLDAATPALDTATLLARRLAAAESAHGRLSQLPPEQRLAPVALQVHGLSLGLDHGEAPPRPVLVGDRSSLAATMAVLRTGQGFAQRGFALRDWQALPSALLASWAVLMLAAGVASRARPRVLALWAGAGLLLAGGTVVLVDIALSGPPDLRYLFERQFVRFPAGDGALPLLVHWPESLPALHALPPLWWPALAAAGLVLLLPIMWQHLSALAAPLRVWLALAEQPRGAAVLMLVLLAAGVSAVLAGGMAAAMSEWLVLLAVLGLATFTASGAALANAGGRVGPAPWAVAGVALVCALAGSAWRMDLGHALVALAAGAAFAWLFGPAWLRTALLAVLGLGSAALVLLLAGVTPANMEAAGAWPWLESALPAHALERVRSWLDPFAAEASDLARMRWLVARAGVDGWGPGYVPWQGLAPQRLADGLPLQAPSDYVLGLVAALWGRPGGFAWLGLVLLVFVGAGVTGLRAALRPGTADTQRLMAAVGGFGCLVMALKALLSMAGVSGVLPLTGLPVALLGYGPITMVAALVYLALALGHATAPSTVAPLGVFVRPPRPHEGRVARRHKVLAIAAALAVPGLLLAGEWRLARGALADAERHVAERRLADADAVAKALVPAAEVGGSRPAPAACAALNGAVNTWNQKLLRHAESEARAVVAAHGAAAGPWLLDPRLLPDDAVSWPDGRPCSRLARRLGQLAHEDFTRIVGRAASTAADAPRAVQSRLLHTTRAPGARAIDYTTFDAWWGLPGCVLTPGEEPSRCAPGTVRASQMDEDPAPRPETALDPWLERDLLPRLHGALRLPSGTTPFNGRDVPRGPALTLSLNPRWQAEAQRIADCFTGQLRGAECAAVLPADAAWRERYFDGADSLRAGALGIVMLDVESGRVEALAGALSACSANALRRRATADSDGRTRALRPGERCAQLPDRRSAWAITQHPALWKVPTGSALKPLAVAAGIDSGHVAPGTDAQWTAILAESEQREPVQAAALAAGETYLVQLRRAAVDDRQLDLLWGLTPGDRNGRGWLVSTAEGTGGLRAVRMSLAEAERIRGDKLAGIDVDRREGPDVMREFMAARRLADAAIGGGDLRASALGVAHLWRGLELAAQGRSTAPPVHLLSLAGQEPAAMPTDMFSTTAARRLRVMTSGVSATAWKGTARGSCRVVFGACPAQGLVDAAALSGKTGSADFLLEEHSPLAKPGQQFPAKLFGGVFTAPNGRRYAVGVMVLRVRDGNLPKLEQASSGAAEAAFTLMRGMGVRP